MEPAMYFVIILSSILFFFVIVLAIVFLSFRRSKSWPHQDSPRSRPSTVASSNRSRMAARWAHMDQAIDTRKTADGIKTQNETYEGVEELNPTHDAHAPDGEHDLPDEFGAGGGIASSRSRRGSIPSSATGSVLVGAGPNGTRTFLKGWFGLDEPNHSGFNVTPEVREKDRSDTLPMRTPGYPSSSIAGDPVPHHRVPTTEEDDWETASAHEELA